MKQLLYNSSFFVLLFIALVSVTLVFCDWMKRAPNETFIKIDGDGKDYYSYLTSAFITKDLAHLKPDNNFVVETPTGNINLHPVGVAVLQLPFFGLGYVGALLSQQPLDGYSLPFQLAIGFAALFYAIIGFLFIYKTLVNLQFQKNVVFWSLFCLFFGTTLLHYTITEPSMSHIYSFALISAFIYYAQKLSQQFSSRDLYLLAILLGLIILVRPVNAIVLLVIPFFYKSVSDLKHQLKLLVTQKKQLLLAVVITLAISSIQNSIWFIQTGKFFQLGYKGQGFYFLNPKIISMIFSFNSGIFIYTPLLILIIPSFILIYKGNKYKAISLFVFLFFVLYVFSSWWCWTYFDGIGTRPVVDFYALAAIAICYVFRALTSVQKKYSMAAFAGLCVIFNFIISYQYKEGILQSSGMNYDKFKYVFLKTSPAYKNVLGGCYDLQPYSAQPKKPFIIYNNDFETEKNHFYSYGQSEYGVEFKSPHLAIDSRKIHVKISLDRLELKKNSTQNVLMAVSLNDSNNKCKSWQAFKINDTPSKVNYSNWKHYDYGVNIMSNIRDTDQLAVFIWNKEKQTFGIDNFKIELYDYGHIN